MKPINIGETSQQKFRRKNHHYGRDHMRRKREVFGWAYGLKKKAISVRILGVLVDPCWLGGR